MSKKANAVLHFLEWTVILFIAIKLHWPMLAQWIGFFLIVYAMIAIRAGFFKIPESEKKHEPTEKIGGIGGDE